MNSCPTWTGLLAVFLLSASLGRASEAVEVVPAALRGVVQPQVTVSPAGNVFIVFGKGTSIYCAAADGALNFTAPVQIATLPKLALGMRRGPRVAATDQRVVVSAISHASGNLYAWSSSDHGVTWTPAVPINSVTNSAREGMHGMASDGHGAIHAVWLDLRNGKTELWGAASRDGGQTWGTNKLVYKSPDEHICECCHPTVAVDGQGRVWAMWRNWLDGARDMFVAVSSDGGESFSSARKLGSGTWPLKACPMDGGSLTFDGDGKLLTVWRRDRAIIAADETTETPLNAEGSQPVVGTGRGGPYYLWQKGSKLMWKRDSNDIAVFAEAGAYPAISAASATGVPVIAWEATVDGAKTILAKKVK